MGKIPRGVDEQHQHQAATWSVNGSCGWISCCGYSSPGSQTRRKRRRTMNGDVVFSSSCSDSRHRCQRSADPCWLSVSWDNTHRSRVEVR
ncbi:hypothetical protein AMECASPLE_037908 [Ameca splendens]|uniref:Uncharacterized protein n=1 Tax=Ameca splendens TaxID=208324 RepID=A0ABV0ZTW1_9TELE